MAVRYKAVIGYYLIDLETPANSFVALISFYHIALQNVIHLLSISSVKEWGGGGLNDD